MIEEKRYYYIRIKLLSPLSIGSGESTLTDHDCIRDSKGNPLIPGTTLAGCFSSYFTKEENEIFTPKIDDEYKMSPYFISDARIPEEYVGKIHTSIRDGVKLTKDKVAEDGAKYDMEVVETGTIFDFRIELTIRKQDNKNQMKALIDVMLTGLQNGEILLGLKSKRGYGKVKIEQVAYQVFQKGDIKRLLDFNPYDIHSYEPYSIPTIERAPSYDVIRVSLKQLGGISIRQYSAQKGNVDFEHVTSNHIPVIPGTSWAGLFRRQVEEYLEMPIFSDFSLQVEDWFGMVEKEKAVASNIIFEESTIHNATQLEIYRNKIDRFSGGVKERALFAERAYFDGDSMLTIKIKKSILQNGKSVDNIKIKELLLLVIKELANGMIALGGQTAIGRGIFEVEKVTINEKEYDIQKNIIEEVSI